MLFLNYTGAPMTGLLRPWMLKASSPSGGPNAPQLRFCPMTDFPLQAPFHHFDWRSTSHLDFTDLLLLKSLV